jgi:hypothetical protein
MYRITVLYNDGSRNEIKATGIVATCKIFEILTNDPNVNCIDIYNPDGKNITNQRYDQE